MDSHARRLRPSITSRPSVLCQQPFSPPHSPSLLFSTIFSSFITYLSAQIDFYLFFYSEGSHFSRQTSILFSVPFPSYFLITVLSVDLASSDNLTQLEGRPLDATSRLILSFPSPPLQLFRPGLRQLCLQKHILQSGIYVLTLHCILHQASLHLK